MHTGHNPKLRFGMTMHEARDSSFEPALANGPPLPAVNYGLVGKQAPSLLPTRSGQLPKASAVVMTWADAEWAALEHVFCAGGSPMPYSERSRGEWAGWEKYSAHLPSDKPSGWSFWGYYRTVQVSGETVLLFKSNTHLDWPGATFLTALIKLMIANVNPSVILSVGTAGGAKPEDHIGTVRAVSAGTLYETGQSQSSWPEYKNGWKANGATTGNANFKQLLFPAPMKESDLQALCSQFNQHYRQQDHTSYTLAQLDPNGLNLGDPVPQIDDQTGGGASLLTTSTFVVGTTAGTYQNYTSIEMDDAVIGEACASSNTAFGFVRNVSDPVQNAALPPKVQGNWGSALYDACGLYTSYNGAVAAWAMLA
jgi:nucleoside phosphorylase